MTQLPKKKSARRTRKLNLERLESRHLLVTWGGASLVGGPGDWGNDNHWIPSPKPKPSETALFDADGSPTLSVPETVNAIDVHGNGSGSGSDEVAINLNGKALTATSFVSVRSDGPGETDSAKLTITNSGVQAVLTTGSLQVGAVAAFPDADDLAMFAAEDPEVGISVGGNVMVGERPKVS